VRKSPGKNFSLDKLFVSVNSHYQLLKFAQLGFLSYWGYLPVGLIIGPYMGRANGILTAVRRELPRSIWHPPNAALTGALWSEFSKKKKKKKKGKKRKTHVGLVA
jgi:hypothetical protein